MKDKENLMKKGFTLIEILVVIAILGILSSVVLVQFPGAMKKARDGRRLENAQTVLTALRMYLTENDYFPIVSSYGESEAGCGGWDSLAVDNDGDGEFFIEPLVTEGYVPKMPMDPLGESTCDGHTCKYYRFNAGDYGCDSSRGGFFVFGINDMESSDNPYPDSPGWSCPEKDWQEDFDWVTGGFER